MPTIQGTTYPPSITGSGGRFFVVAVPTDIAVNRTLTRLNLSLRIWNNQTLTREVVDMHSVDPDYAADVADFLVQVVLCGTCCTHCLHLCGLCMCQVERENKHVQQVSSSQAPRGPIPFALPVNTDLNFTVTYWYDSTGYSIPGAFGDDNRARFPRAGWYNRTNDCNLLVLHGLDSMLVPPSMCWCGTGLCDAFATYHRFPPRRPSSNGSPT